MFTRVAGNADSSSQTHLVGLLRLRDGLVLADYPVLAATEADAMKAIQDDIEVAHARANPGKPPVLGCVYLGLANKKA